MNISGLLTAIEELESYRLLRQDLQQGDMPAPLGLMRAARAPVLAALGRGVTRDRCGAVLVAAGTTGRAQKVLQSLRDWSVDPARVLRFPEPLTLFYDRAPWTDEIIIGRLQVLSALHEEMESAGEGRPLMVVASARALMQRTLPLHQYRLSVREVAVGQILDLERTLRRWAGLGYEPVSVVEAAGQYSHRGGIIDIFPPADVLPVRIELWGNQVDSMRRFDPATQRSQERVEKVRITPAREALPRHGAGAAERVGELLEEDLPEDILEELSEHHRGLVDSAPFPGLEFYLPYLYSRPATLLDYLPEDGLVVVDDEWELADAWAELEQEALDLKRSVETTGALPEDYPLPYATWDEWSEMRTDQPVLTLGHGREEAASQLGNCFVPGPCFGGQLRPLLDHIETAQVRGDRVVLVSRQARRLADLWSREHAYISPVEDLRDAPRSTLTFVQGALDEGWVLQPVSGVSTQLLTDGEIFGWRRPAPRRPVHRRKTAPESTFSDFSPGDHVVHVEYGIGVFRGLVTRSLEGGEQEYLLIEYGGEDRLFVPIYQTDRLSRYVGADDRPPELSRLGKAQWRDVKERVKKATEEVARELLDLYAARELAEGHSYRPDTPWQTELEASFPYYETPGQREAIGDVKDDMESPQPMDRLICGDVGYGKTEVAVRAAFKAVMDGRQAAVLVPTTVLAQQHYATFRQRMEPFPVEIEMLSRFRTGAEQEEILEKLLAEQIDVVIGTHRLLQDDVAFADLGLLIIDEEQRFGVTHKEKFKKVRTQLDVLTMTATPIPRTLYMALTGVRDISVIETPPEERLPVSTYVGDYDTSLIRRAILRELERGGQVFYVHNRVQTIEVARRRLERIVPEATFGVAHGRMRGRDLEDTMVRFVDGKIDVLVCTTIIESGLDIPAANTLIVERAGRLGLAQLYQLRGRVGRAAERAYAYLFRERESRLTPEARRRLETIREASGLGDGYAIAMRDLEIRGAGDILGTRQSGHISAVGFHLYARLLSRAVEELKAEREGKPPPPEPLADIRIDLPIPVSLPEDYVADTWLRLKMYRRLAELNSMAEIEEMERELVDRFGPLPRPAQNLMYQLRLKALARDAGVGVVTMDNGRLALRSGGREFPREDLLQVLNGQASISRYGIWLPKEAGWEEMLVDVLKKVASVMRD
ncbi:MAG: transcription-repair coupling factor [Chloroflexota bacterium]|nr:transcription-repair coupling factor [Chloroflexota bacterium]